MPTFEINPRWGVQLEGAIEDITALQELLNNSVESQDDLIIFYFGEIPLLRTLQWDDFTEPLEVEENASERLRLLSGCLSLLNGSGLIKTGTIFEFFENNTHNQYRITRNVISVRKPNPGIKSPNEFKRIIGLADKHEWLAGCLPLFAPRQDWFSIYKAIESLKMHFDNSEEQLKSKLTNSSDVMKVKRMANSMRHLDQNTHRPPNPPINLETAIGIVSAAVISVIETL